MRIARIINQSFESGVVLKAFKLAAITPITKKVNLIVDLLKNFHPIPNVPFLLKVMEKVATKQLMEHKETHKLREENGIQKIN